MPKLHLFYIIAICLAAGAAHAAGTTQGAPGSATGANTASPSVLTTQNAPGTATPAKTAAPAERHMNPWDMSTWKFHAGESSNQPTTAKTSGAR
jgi:hypothetical protein